MKSFPRNKQTKKGKRLTPSTQGRLKLVFEKFDPEEPIMLVCGHSVLYKNVSKYGYGWCVKCGRRMAKMY